MPQPVDALFAFQGPKREILHVIIDLVKSFLAENGRASRQLVDRLKTYNPGDHPSLQQYDIDLVNMVFGTVIEVLEDDNSLTFLVDKLSDYYGRVLAATMLGWFGPRAREVVPQLIGIASGTGVAVGVAKQAILLIGYPESETLAALRASVLENDDGAFRELCDLTAQAGYDSTS